MNAAPMMTGMGMKGRPDPGLLAAALGGGVDSMGGDELPQVLIDFPMQPPAPTPDDGMMLGGFPGGNLADPDAQLLQQLMGAGPGMGMGASMGMGAAPPAPGLGGLPAQGGMGLGLAGR